MLATFSLSIHLFWFWFGGGNSYLKENLSDPILTQECPRPQLQFTRLRDTIYTYDQRLTLTIQIPEILVGTPLTYYTVGGTHAAWLMAPNLL